MDLQAIYCEATLYNTEQLHELLGIQEVRLPINELICSAFSKWGEAVVKHLYGDFAFVLLDAETNFLYCARDPLGIRPFYYTKTSDGFHFAARIEELFAIPGVQKKPNISAIRTMLYQRSVKYEHTLYEGIFRLPPSHCMAIKNNEVRIERYWFPETIKIDYSITEEDAAEKLKALLSKAVRLRMSTFEETAFELSGGLDSSSIVSLAAYELGGPTSIDGYSMYFEGLKCDETRYISALLKKYPLKHQAVQSADLDYLKTYTLDYLYRICPNWPFVTTAAMVLPMYARMKQDGKKVVLTGQGGDHLLTGTPLVIYDLLKRFRFKALYAEVHEWEHPLNAVKSNIIAPLLGTGNTRFLKKIFKRESNPFMKTDGSIENLTQKAAVRNPVLRHELDMITSAGSVTNLDGSTFHFLEHFFDMEIRHPFFDIDLVEFALSLPPEMKRKQCTIKWTLREAMDGILPDNIRERNDKADFSEVLMQQIEAIDLDALLDAPYLVRLGIIEQRVINEHRKAFEDRTVKHIIFLWTIINVEFWYRINFNH